MTSTPAPAWARSSTLPDYYGDERRALRRVRFRHSVRWLVLAVTGAAVLVWQTRR